MSYNPLHHTNWFKPSDTPGIMIPEDIRGLALNDLAFPNLEFDPQKDIPSGYKIADIVSLGIMEKFCAPLDMEATDTIYVFSNVSPGTAYYWRVQGRNNFNYGSGEWSEIRKFIVKNTVAIEEENHSGSKFFDFARVRDPLKTSLHIYNVQGKLVTASFDGTLSQGMHRLTWKSSLHGQGLYVVRFDIGMSHAAKLVVLPRYPR